MATSIKWHIVTHPIVQTDDPETDASRCQLDRHNVRIHGWLLRNDVIAPANESYATWLVRGASLSHRETYFSHLLLYYFEIIIEFYCIRRVYERRSCFIDRHFKNWSQKLSNFAYKSWNSFAQNDTDGIFTIWWRTRIHSNSCTHQGWETWHFEFKFLIRHAIRCVCIKFCRKLRRVLR